MKERTRVLVTGSNSVGAQILYAINRVPDDTVTSRWDPVAADANPFAFGLYQTEPSVILPLASDPNYLSALRAEVKKHAIKTILPGTEAETFVLTAQGDHFEGA
jgi:hypothetical protein